VEWIAAIAAAVSVPFLVAAISRREGQTYADRLQEVSDWFSKTGDALQKGGAGMQAAGCGLTLAITVPFLGFVFFGWPGLIIGLIIAVAFGGAAFRGDKGSPPSPPAS
jgi:hypothetical protein